MFHNGWKVGNAYVSKLYSVLHLNIEYNRNIWGFFLSIFRFIKVLFNRTYPLVFENFPIKDTEEPQIGG